MNCPSAFSNPEIIKVFAYTIIYPLVIWFTAFKLAKFHFEKGIKEKYLLAKDKVATDITNYICIMLKAIWEIVNIDSWIASGSKTPDLTQRKQQAYETFHKAVLDSYSSIGQLGLYFETEIVEGINQLKVKRFNYQKRHWQSYLLCLKMMRCKCGAKFIR